MRKILFFLFLFGCTSMRPEMGWHDVAISAMENSDPTLCAQIGGREERGHCYSLSAVCPEEGDWCYFSEAMFMNDRRICRRMGEDGSRACHAIISGSQEECWDILDEEWRDVCFFYIARRSSDFSPCLNISQQDISEYCKALVLKDERGCSRIADPYYKGECFGELSQSPEGCPPSDHYIRDLCILHHASRVNDPEICAGMGWAMRDACYKVMGMAFLERHLCKKISSMKEKTICLAVVDHDQSLCDLLSGDDKRECVYEFYRNGG